MAPSSITCSAACRAPSGVPRVSRGNRTRSLSATSNSAICAASCMSLARPAAGPLSGSSRPTRASAGACLLQLPLRRLRGRGRLRYVVRRTGCQQEQQTEP